MQYRESFECLLFAFMTFILIFACQMMIRDTYIYLMLVTIWVPQIIQNSMQGYKNAPSMFYVVCQQVNVLSLPLYLKLSPRNFLMIQEDRKCGQIIIALVFLQFLILAIQQKQPRFLIPSSLRHHFIKEYYRYSHDFEHEAGMSSNSYLSLLS